MTSTATATVVLDAFLAARASTAPAERSSIRRTLVVEQLRSHLEARGAAPIDDLTAHRLRHDRGRAPTEHELGAALSVISEMTGFFGRLRTEPGAEPDDLAGAADVVRDLARWLLERDLVDPDVARHLECYTHLFDVGHQRTGT